MYDTENWEYSESYENNYIDESDWRCYFPRCGTLNNFIHDTDLAINAYDRDEAKRIKKEIIKKLGKFDSYKQNDPWSSIVFYKNNETCGLFNIHGEVYKAKRCNKNVLGDYIYTRID